MKEQSPCHTLLQSRQIFNVQQKESERQSLHVMFNAMLESEHQRFCYQSVGSITEWGIWLPKRKHPGFLIGAHGPNCMYDRGKCCNNLLGGCILLVSAQVWHIFRIIFLERGGRSIWKGILVVLKVEDPFEYCSNTTCPLVLAGYYEMCVWLIASTIWALHI